MNRIAKVDVSSHALDIFKDLSIVPREYEPGPPKRIDGVSVGIITMSQSAPHGGEVHPDGDEILYVVSGRLRVVGDSYPDEPVEVGPGEVCIVPKGEWHKVDVLEKTNLIHITPGPGGDHRPLQ